MAFVHSLASYSSRALSPCVFPARFKYLPVFVPDVGVSLGFVFYCCKPFLSTMAALNLFAKGKELAEKAYVTSCLR